ncbi:MAG: hypothetical protein NPIRA03_14000 [Nitrospirales bacterium]|nr:MAG: hypothetical protein NPIRA03_14000 [Nitrospirales bacterium]
MDKDLSRFQCYRKYKSRPWLNLVSQGTTLVATPFIYAMIIPLLVFDFCVELYQRVVFPLLGLPLLSRREYIRLDRHRHPYLNPFQKAGCLYCGYANGLLHYASRIAAETEKVFCPIQHQSGGKFHPPAHHIDFAPYGDDKVFQRKMGS